MLLDDYIRQNDPNASNDTGSEEKDGKPTKGTVNGAIKNLYANPDEVGMDYTFVDEEFQAKWPPRPIPGLSVSCFSTLLFFIIFYNKNA